MQGLIDGAHCKWARAIGFGEGRGLNGRLGRITLTMVFGMLGYVHVPTPPALRAADVGSRARKSLRMQKW
jgi:hypothetical protein